MVLPPDQLLAELLQLPADARARLAESLLASLDEDTEVDAAWGTELERRAAAVEAGEMALRPAGDVFRDARARLHSA